MMKRTLLQMTQDILNALNSDEVNSIGDTTESLQVVNCLRTTYFNMLSKYDLPEHETLFQLVGSADITRPVLMTRPTGISSIRWIKYYDTNPADDASGTQISQFGSYSHDLNVDIIPNATTQTATWDATITPGVVFGSSSTFSLVVSGYQAKYNTGSPKIGESITLTGSVSGAVLIGSVTAWTLGTLTLGGKITKLMGSPVASDSFHIVNTTPQFTPGYREVKIISLEDFLKVTGNLDLNDANVDQMYLQVPNLPASDNIVGNSNESFTFNYRNDLQPKYCCIINNQYLVFDSYDNTQDSSLQASKTMCLGWQFPQWEDVDGFIPRLDENLFPLLYNEAKSLAFFELKQQPHLKAEAEIKAQKSIVQKFKNIAERPSTFDALPNFGRRGGGTGR